MFHIFSETFLKRKIKIKNYQVLLKQSIKILSVREVVIAGASSPYGGGTGVGGVVVEICTVSLTLAQKMRSTLTLMSNPSRLRALTLTLATLEQRPNQLSIVLALIGL